MKSPTLLCSRLFLAAAILLSASTSFGEPESPAIWREVTGVINDHSSGSPVPKFTRPHMPGFRTSEDGRVAVICEAGGGVGMPSFTLMKPEKMTEPFLKNAPGAHTMSWTQFKWLDGYSSAAASRTQFTTGGKNPSHACLWETSPPTVVNGEDVYNLKVIVTSNSGSGADRRTQIFATPIKVYVSNPKTPAAAIRSIVKTGNTVAGPVYNFQASGFEPVVVGDGRLLVMRVGSGAMPWNGKTQGMDIVYSYYNGGSPADPRNWTQLHPISHAPYDTRINNKFGFAKFPFRDGEGNIIPDGEDIGGSYPWMDREARLLFFEAVGDQLHFPGANGVWNQSRYPHRATPDEPIFYGPEFGGKHQGVTMMGLWTHGKMVQIDNLNNDMDYAVASANPAPIRENPVGSQREVKLFQVNSGPYGDESGWLRMGMGRATMNMPFGENDNGNIIDSLEQLFNYRKDFEPISFGDVVWPLTNGKQTDEIVFDDYIDPDAFIIATMAGHLSFNVNGALNSAGNNYPNLIHHSGWNPTTKQFDQPVKLQNAATAPANRWTVPKFGLVTGSSGRLEPAATGGIRGKGFWVDHQSGLQFTIPAQAPGKNVANHNWYVGLFVDSRFGDDNAMRRLITFSDGTSISLIGRRQVIYRDSAGVIRNRISLPLENTASPRGPLDEVIPDSGWAHLAFQIRDAGTDITMHLNGLPYNRWSDPYTSLFQFTAGTLKIGPGAAGATPFRGWIDDFKVFAHEVDLETCCNHAGGTLIGLQSNYTGIWKTKVADRYPAWTHQYISEVLRNNGETTYPQYACFRDYTADHGVHLSRTPPARTKALRSSIHFPEGPIFHNRPRPDSASNKFCLTCHHIAGKPGLDIAALELDPAVNAANDNRRQPKQPNKRIYGRIPAGLIESRNLPGNDVNLGSAGKLIDQWMLSGFNNSTSVVSFSVVDPATGNELMELRANSIVDPAVLGQSNLTLRANLDRAQGHVVMTYDGSARTRNAPPYTAFGTNSNPLQGVTLTPGSHTLVANPQFGTSRSVTFTVPRNSARVIADYQDDFTTHSPDKPWKFAWNRWGEVSNPDHFDLLSWSPSKNRYTADGSSTYPLPTDQGAYVALHPTGGHPGRGSSQGQNHDRFALTGYTAKLGGYYAVTHSVVKMGSTHSNGGQLVIYKDVNNGTNFTQVRNSVFNSGGNFVFNSNVGFLEAGDTIWVGVGPRGGDSSDGFSLDFSISFKENGNPL